LSYQFNINIMKVPTYQKYGLKKSQVEKSDSRDMQVSIMLSHTLPLYLGIGLGILVYIFYYTKTHPTGFLQIITQVFLFATIGVMCVGVPVIIFKLAERFYYNFLSKHSDKYITIQDYKNSREGFEFWKLRQDASFWRYLDGLSVENEVINLYVYQGYEVKHGVVNDAEYDHVLSRDGKDYYFAFRTNRIFDDTKDIDRLLAETERTGCEELIIIASKGISKRAAGYLEDKPAKYLTTKEIIALIRTIKK
jgi:hypothetical protein